MFQLFHFLIYLFKAKDAHGIHPPFLFNLYKDVILKTSVSDKFLVIESLRKEMLRSTGTIEVLDYGAGSKVNKGPERKIADIARSALTNPKYAALHYRLASHFKPAVIVELGTSLGINTLYLSMGNPDAKVYTFEGCPEIAALAKSNFKKAKANNITIVEGTFEKTLENQLSYLSTVDYVFIDGHHDRQATLAYFNIVLQHSNENTVIVLDDINWSPGMRAAWQEIKAKNKVKLAVDLYKWGIVFLSEKLTKQDFVLRF